MKKLLSHKRNRIIAIIMAVLLMAVSLAVGLNATLAASVDNIRLEQQNSYNVVKVNGTAQLQIIGIMSWSSGDRNIATVPQGRTNDTVTITGVKAGVVGIGGGNQSGNSVTRPYQVVDAGKITGYDIPKNGIGFMKNVSTKELDIDFYRSPDPAAGTVESQTPAEKKDALQYIKDNTLGSQVVWSSLHPEIVKVEDGNLIGGKEGVTLLIGEFTDRWGVTQTIHYLFGVGVVPGNSSLNDLIDAINKGKDLQEDADANPGKYDADKLIELENAIREGELVLENASSTDDDYKDAAKDILDIIDALKPQGGNNTIPLIPDKDNTGDSNDEWYRPVKIPEHVYEVVDKDGNPKQPPEYIYDEDKDGDPNTGNQRPAHGPDNGIFYVEDPIGSNIYKPVDKNGDLSDNGAIWGGNDNTFGSSDDEPAVKNNGKWYASHGQNIFQEINLDTGRLTGDMLGGGPNKKPGDQLNLTTNNIFQNENDGKYYAGPFTDSEGEYYIGDKRPAQGGILSFNYGSNVVIDDTDQKYYLDENGNMVTTKPVVITPVEPEDLLSIKIDGQNIVDASDQMTSFLYTVNIEGLGEFTDRANWTVDGIEGAAMVPAKNSKASYLRLPAHAEGKVTITATAVGDEKTVATLEVTVRNPSIWANTPEGGEFTADGVEWVVIGRNLGPSGNDMMIMTKYVQSAGSVRWYTSGDGGSSYSNSMFQTAVDSFYGGLGQLRPYAVLPKSLGTSTTEITNSSGVKAETQTKGVMFPLSLAETTALPNQLRIGKDVENPTGDAVEYWTRSTYPSYYAYYVLKSGSTHYEYRNYSKGMRPVMFVNFNT